RRSDRRLRRQRPRRLCAVAARPARRQAARRSGRDDARWRADRAPGPAHHERAAPGRARVRTRRHDRHRRAARRRLLAPRRARHHAAARTLTSKHSPLSLASARVSGPDARVRTLALAMLAVCPGALLAAWQAAANWPFFSDDAFISLRFAQRLLDGKGL